MLITQSGNFQKFEFKSLAGISSNTGRSKSNQIELTVAALFLLALALSPCSWETPRSSPAPPAPTQAVRSGGRRRNAPRAPSQSSSSLHDADHPALARADPQHPAAKPEPSQHAPETAVPGATFESCQGPRSGEVLDALSPDAPTYKYPRRSNGDTRPVPSYLPDTLVSPRSL
jgi:hypothetical protein